MITFFEGFLDPWSIVLTVYFTHRSNTDKERNCSDAFSDCLKGEIISPLKLIAAIAILLLVSFEDSALAQTRGLAGRGPSATPPPLGDPCCPPWNKMLLQDMLVYQPTGPIPAPYKLIFTPTSTFMNTIQAYINYLNNYSGGAIKNIIIQWEITDQGIGLTPLGYPNYPSSGKSGCPDTLGPRIPLTYAPNPIYMALWTEWTAMGEYSPVPPNLPGGGGNITNNPGVPATLGTPPHDPVFKEALLQYNHTP